MRSFIEEKRYLEQNAPKLDSLYNNKELEQLLVRFQAAISHVMLSFGITEKIMPRDIISFLELLAKENGVEQDETFQRLRDELKDLGFLIGSLKKGSTGEKRTRDGLRNLEFSPDVKILYNITLDDGTDRTEYDAIVLSPYGIFVIEAKNFNGNARITEKGILLRDNDRFGAYNLGERMIRKEFLLRSCMGKLASVPYHALLLYVNEQADIEDNYHQIPITYCNTVAKTIQQFDHGDELITPDELKQIEVAIINHQIDARYPCNIDCQQIICDLIFILQKIINTKDPCIPKESYTQTQNVSKSRQIQEKRYPWYKKAGWALLGFCIGIGTGTGGITLYNQHKSPN